MNIRFLKTEPEQITLDEADLGTVFRLPESDKVYMLLDTSEVKHTPVAGLEYAVNLCNGQVCKFKSSCLVIELDGEMSLSAVYARA